MDDLIVSGKPLGELKVTELKDELGKRSLSKSGNKSQLAQRLGEYLLANPEGSPVPVKEHSSPHKASPEKTTPGDTNPFIAQYLAERESLLAESLDHKRKVQAVAEKRTEDIEKPPLENAENNSMAPSQAEGTSVAEAPSVHEEEIAQEASPNSRRKGRKPELRRSDRSEQEAQEASENNAGLDLSVSSPRKTLSPSPKKDSTPLGSQPVVVESKASPAAAVEQNDVTVGATASVGQPNSFLHNNDILVSSNSKNDLVKDVVRDVPEESWTMEVNEAQPTPAFLRDAVNVRPAAGEESVPEHSVRKEVREETKNDDAFDDVEVTLDVDEPTEQSAEPSQTSTPTEETSSGLRNQTILDRSLNAPNSSNSTGTAKDESENSGEKPGHTSNLAKTLSIDEEKLDYGEIEGDDELTVKEEQKAAVPTVRTPSPRGQKRPTSPIRKESDKSSRKSSSYKAADEKTASMKSNGSHEETAKEGREPPRKMSRYGLGPIREEVQKIVCADAAADSKRALDASDNKRGLSPPSSRATPTALLHIKNLTRPFTEKQLKEMLSKTGTLVEGPDHFWLDSIKSQCIATFSTVEEAEATRRALFNLVWPASNPRQLFAEFIREDEFKQKTSVPSTPVTPIGLPDSGNKRTLSSGLRPQIDRGQVEKLKITVASNKETGEAHRDVAIAREEKRLERRAEREKELEARVGGKDETDNKTLSPKKEPAAAEREWDRGKPAPEDTLKVKTETEPTKPVGIPLDVLFHRTETRPQIYWKPLTEEQVKARDEEEQKLAAEREERRKQFDQDRPRPGAGTDENNKFRSDRMRRDASRERPRESPRRRSRSPRRDDRGGARPGSYRRSSPVRRRPSPSPRYSGGGRRRSRSRSPVGRRY
ncbi:hypothetical protein RvY_07496 [Ramazzottius varieornatus]|uniref:SAP domain-containing protein n=1 Tax=Ramazzottius varieornatus TaxID=947166 RepID=A0A1D1V5H4_RAMVA|nr:hypothetical protein RvY_07496 [Ramazzottius varieornatus]